MRNAPIPAVRRYVLRLLLVGICASLACPSGIAALPADDYPSPDQLAPRLLLQQTPARQGITRHAVFSFLFTAIAALIPASRGPLPPHDIGTALPENITLTTALPRAVMHRHTLVIDLNGTPLSSYSQRNGAQSLMIAAGPANADKTLSFQISLSVDEAERTVFVNAVADKNGTAFIPIFAPGLFPSLREDWRWEKMTIIPLELNMTPEITAAFSTLPATNHARQILLAGTKGTSSHNDLKIPLNTASLSDLQQAGAQSLIMTVNRPAAMVTARIWLLTTEQRASPYIDYTGQTDATGNLVVPIFDQNIFPLSRTMFSEKLESIIAQIDNEPLSALGLSIVPFAPALSPDSPWGDQTLIIGGTLQNYSGGKIYLNNTSLAALIQSGAQSFKIVLDRTTSRPALTILLHIAGASAVPINTARFSMDKNGTLSIPLADIERQHPGIKDSQLAAITVTVYRGGKITAMGITGVYTNPVPGPKQTAREHTALPPVTLRTTQRAPLAESI